ncbi:MAG: hypothetical protein ACRDQZ_12720 [Mycobacteriales bacterium]
MSEKQLPDHPVSQASPGPHRVRLPGFIIDEDVGLGDVIKKATSIAGIRPCGGCAGRAGRLNNWMVFGKRR